eukprot:10317_1
MDDIIGKNNHNNNNEEEYYDDSDDNIIKTLRQKSVNDSMNRLKINKVDYGVSRGVSWGTVTRIELDYAIDSEFEVANNNNNKPKLIHSSSNSSNIQKDKKHNTVIKPSKKQLLHDEFVEEMYQVKPIQKTRSLTLDIDDEFVSQIMTYEHQNQLFNRWILIFTAKKKHNVEFSHDAYTEIINIYQNKPDVIMKMKLDAYLVPLQGNTS